MTLCGDIAVLSSGANQKSDKSLNARPWIGAMLHSILPMFTRWNSEVGYSVVGIMQCPGVGRGSEV